MKWLFAWACTSGVEHNYYYVDGLLRTEEIDEPMYFAECCRSDFIEESFASTRKDKK